MYIYTFILLFRPETEELVEMVLDYLGPGGKGEAYRILDVGAGSGAIGLALLHSLPKSTCMAIDVSTAMRILVQHWTLILIHWPRVQVPLLLREFFSFFSFFYSCSLVVSDRSPDNTFYMSGQ